MDNCRGYISGRAHCFVHRRRRCCRRCRRSCRRRRRRRRRRQRRLFRSLPTRPAGPLVLSRHTAPLRRETGVHSPAPFSVVG